MSALCVEGGHETRRDVHERDVSLRQTCPCDSVASGSRARLAEAPDVELDVGGAAAAAAAAAWNIPFANARDGW